ncbi:hypothetical protein D3C75_662690 [compost metagenome]
MRRIGGRGRGGIGGRTHTGFVGEETALDAVDHRLGDGVTHGTGTRLLDTEGRLDDENKDPGQLADVHGHHEQRHQDVGQRHEGHHQLGEAGYATDAAEDDEAGQHHQCQAADPVRDAEGDVHGQADGVGLHRIEHQTECQQQTEGEDHPHPAHAEPTLHVVGGTTTVVAVFILDLVELGQGTLDEGGGHADEGDQPHPEDGTRPPQIDGDGHTGQVAGAHTGSQAGTQGLEGGDAGTVGFAAIAQYREHVAEVTDLDKPQAEGKEESDPDQQVNEHGSPHQVVNHCNQGVHNSLVVITSMVSLR